MYEENKKLHTMAKITLNLLSNKSYYLDLPKHFSQQNNIHTWNIEISFLLLAYVFLAYEISMNYCQSYEEN